MTAAEMKTALSQARQELMKTKALLARILRALPEPEFEAGTDRPLNTAAELYGLLDVARRDEVAVVISTLSRAHDLAKVLP